MGRSIDDDENNSDEEDNDDSDDENENSGWGKKSNYYSGDTADLEIGQDHADAEDEEAAAKELQNEQLSKRQEIDYADSDEEITTRKSDKLTKEIEKRSQNKKSGKMVIEKLERNIHKLSKKQRLEILKSEAPEMLGLVEELNDKFKDLKERIEPLKTAVDKLSKLQQVDDELCLYLQAKQQLLASYCVNILFYLMLKADGVSVQAHPVMKQLLKLRYLMEKMRQLDSKMKHQIDRLLSSSNIESTNEKLSSSRPNISSLLEVVNEDNDNDTDESNDSDDNDNDKRNKSSKGVYRPPKLNAVPYKDDKDITQLEEKIQRKKKKIKNSEILEALREEFGHAPEQSSSSGLGNLTKEQHDIDKEMEERRKFEEERFVRLTLSKKDKKALKKRRELNFNPSQELVADMGDIDDLETLTSLTNNLQSIDPNTKLTNSRISKVGGVNSESLTNALKKAVTVFNQDDTSNNNKNNNNNKSKKLSSTNSLRSADEEDFTAGLNGKNKFNHFDNNNDDDGDNDGFDYGDDNDNDDDLIDNYRESQITENNKKSLKRRRAPDSDFNDNNNDEGNLFEEFSKKKKEFLDKKSKHYQIEQRVGGHEDIVEDPIDHRAASYEIMTNRGLRPHRKKVNRNPRVKKREAYDKALLKRKSQVREGDTSGSGRVAYGGELTGIKANLSRSRRFNS